MDPGKDHDEAVEKRIFTYEEAAALLPEVQRLTTNAIDEIERLAMLELDADARSTGVAQYESVVGRWAMSVMKLGVEVKGMWLVDFDSGSGYYCWKHPEPALQFFHEYETGFGGRVQLN